MDCRVVREELDGVFDGHVQHVGDVLAVVQNLERFLLVAVAFAGWAGDFDVGHERQLRYDLAIAAALFTTSTLHVEAELRRRVAAFLRFVGASEQLANVVVEPNVRRRVRTRCAADW